MSVECEKVGGVNLSQGVCDLEVPEPVRKAAHAAIEAGHNSYSRHDGTRQLREAIAAKYQRLYGLDVDPETNVVVSSGATGALYCACLALLEPGDEVIVFDRALAASDIGELYAISGRTPPPLPKPTVSPSARALSIIFCAYVQ